MKGIYKHYKNKLYQVFFVATHSETEQEMVVYQALWGDYGMWVRPKTMFEEKLDSGAPRFDYVAAHLTDALISEYHIDIAKINPPS